MTRKLATFSQMVRPKRTGFSFWRIPTGCLVHAPTRRNVCERNVLGDVAKKRKEREENKIKKNKNKKGIGIKKNVARGWLFFNVLDFFSPIILLNKVVPRQEKI